MGSRVCAAAGLVETMALTTVSTLVHHLQLELHHPPRRFHAVLNPLPGPGTGLSIRVIGTREPSPTPGLAAPATDLDQLPHLLPSTRSGKPEQPLTAVATRQYAAGGIIIVGRRKQQSSSSRSTDPADVLQSRATGEPQRVDNSTPATISVRSTADLITAHGNRAPGAHGLRALGSTARRSCMSSPSRIS
jgi:hypothetical protein